MYTMKKLLIFSLALLSLWSCKKDENNTPTNTLPPGLTGRLIGDWELTGVYCKTSIPNPLNPLQPINVEGDATAVSGDFVVSYNPNKVVYNYSFSISGGPVPGSFPVNQDGEATWSVISNDTKVLLEEADMDPVIYDVTTNEANLQVWETELPFTIPGVGITVTADIKLTLERK